jgi:hypothetical protein
MNRGLVYLMTDDGVEVPLIDVTHPAFRVEMTGEELDAAVEKAVADVEQRRKMPAEQQALQMKELLRTSFLVPRIAGAQGAVLGGMSTYYMKLGPGNLGSYAADIDRVFAGSLPCLSVRIRLQHAARLLADCLAAAHAARPGRSLHIVDIAGGPCMDSMNALILLRQERPQLLAGTTIGIHALDPDASGPGFGIRALEAMRAAGAPLHDVSATMRHVDYDWSRASELRALLSGLGADGSFIVGASEGGLFEYGSDEEVVANLRTFYEGTAADALFVGTVSSAEGSGRILNEAGGAALRLRG